MDRWILIAAGGALGALARHAALALVEKRALAGVPLGLLVVNVAGSFAAGFVAAQAAAKSGPADPLRAFVAIGFLGAFTTFSAFSVENLAMLREGSLARAGAHAAAHLALSVAAAALGIALAARVS